MEVASIFLGCMVHFVFEKVTSQIQNWMGAGKKKEEAVQEFRKWASHMELIWAVLKDAVAKESDHKAITNWLKDCAGIVLDVEDKLDEFQYEDLLRQAEARVSGNIISCSSPSCPKNFNMSELIAFTDKLKSLVEQATSMNLVKSNLSISSIVCAVPSRTGSGSISCEPVLFGREAEKKRIKEQLLMYGEKENMVIPILGMGGLGKTTLAQHVYHDKDVSEFFDLRVWICVSKDFNSERIWEQLLKAASGVYNQQSIASIDEKLVEVLKDKKFLIVLDDLWNEKYGDWITLLTALKGAPGSKIIVTTRNSEVAKFAKTNDSDGSLVLLSDEDCWSILCSHSGIDLTENPPWMKEISMKIARKCKGLPLAAKTMGGLLRSKNTKDEWESVLNSKSWKGKEEIMAVLKISYDDLPSHLKRCFVFCAIFPEDHVFTEKELVLLWIGQGYIQSKSNDELSPGKCKEEEEEGRCYFRELVSRSFFLPWSCNKSCFVMHDFFRDLAQEVSRDTCCRIQDSGGSRLRTRHLSFQRSNLADVVRELGRSTLSENQPSILRTFLPVGWGVCSVSEDALSSMFSRLKYLRVLCLVNYEGTQLPESIGNLILLRHLDLSESKIKILPSSLRKLYNLHNLILKFCRDLLELPAEIWHLMNLRRLDVSGCSKLRELPQRIECMNLVHLDIDDCWELKEVPVGIQNLKDLQTLPVFIVGDTQGLQLQSLGNLKQLEGKLAISKLENVSSEQEAILAKLQEKKLEELTLKWTSRITNGEELQSDVLEHLQPCMNLKRLSIVGYRGYSFPSWLSGLSDLTVLKLKECRNCYSLSMNNSMNSLKELVIEQCPELKVTLSTLPALSKLWIRICRRVECHTGMNLELVDDIKLQKIEQMGSIFGDKVRNESRHAESLTIEGQSSDCYDYRKHSITLSTFSFMKEFAKEEEMAVEYLNVMNQNNLEVLPEWVCNSKSIMRLKIYQCPKLKTLSNGCFPDTLSSLIISDCENLTSVSSHGGLPSKLKQLVIDQCPKLETLTEKIDCAITRLEITNCSSLKSLSPSGDLPSGLEELVFNKCSRLEILTKRIHHGIHSLSIDEDCPYLIQTISQILYNFPSLSFLSLSSCNSEVINGLLGENGLCMLNNLQDFCLKKCHKILSYPPENLEVRLPESLINLTLESFRDLKCISSSLALGSVRDLQLRDCKQLDMLPEEGLASIQTLHVWNCPLLEKKLSEKDSQLRSMVSGISRLKVNHQPFNFLSW